MSVSLRARKAQRTRDAVASAALALFAEHGYPHTTVTQIAERAEISTRTFFRYFLDKEEVLFGGEKETLEIIADALNDSDPADDPLACAVRIARLVLARLAAAGADLAARERIIEATPALQARSLLKHERYVTAVATGLAMRQVPPEYAELLARVVLTCSLTAYRQWCRSGSPGADLDAEFTRTLRRAADALTHLC